MVAALDQNRLEDAPFGTDTDIDESYLSLDVEGFRAEFPADRLNINGALNEIRSVSRELVAAGIRNIQFGESARKGDTLSLGIGELQRAGLVAFLKRVGIDVSEEEAVSGMGDELRASLKRREARKQARENERLARQREHVARYTVRKELGKPYDIEFINGEKTKFTVVDKTGGRTLYVGMISEKPTFTGFDVKICKAKSIVDTDEGIVYKGLDKVVFEGKVRDILGGVNSRSEEEED
ncbi:MAG: hypothetical protein AAB739_01500 [Patescibacteria group bacterium]